MLARHFGHPAAHHVLGFLDHFAQIRRIQKYIVGRAAALDVPVVDDPSLDENLSQVLGAILPHFLNFIVYQVLLEAKASEHSARMVAMKNATDNAMQLIKDLTLEYNKLRQANITKELLEITTAQMALG